MIRNDNFDLVNDVRYFIFSFTSILVLYTKKKRVALFGYSEIFLHSKLSFFSLQQSILSLTLHLVYTLNGTNGMKMHALFLDAILVWSCTFSMRFLDQWSDNQSSNSTQNFQFFYDFDFWFNAWFRIEFPTIFYCS